MDGPSQFLLYPTSVFHTLPTLHNPRPGCGWVLWFGWCGLYLFWYGGRGSFPHLPAIVHSIYSRRPSFPLGWGAYFMGRISWWSSIALQHPASQSGAILARPREDTLPAKMEREEGVSC